MSTERRPRRQIMNTDKYIYRMTLKNTEDKTAGMRNTEHNFIHGIKTTCVSLVEDYSNTCN